MKKCVEGSQAVAEVVNLCEPDVVSAYPITPQTHIVEKLALIKANGSGNFEFLRADSEFAAASMVLGASATGGRSYTATSAQGLLLMTEVLFSIAGMRFPVVMTCANRAISSPINIWNDQQDSLTVRDSGWAMLYAGDNQSAVDFHILAFKIAEQLQIPVMVNMDGFVLTHTVEEIDIPEREKIKQYLPSYEPIPGTVLDVKNPVTLGSFFTPADYQEARLELDQDLKKIKNLWNKENKIFKKIFGRKYEAVEYYGPSQAKTIMISFGSVIGTIKEVVDELNQKKNKVALVNINLFRPFPDEELIAKLSGAKNIIVVEKDISMGSGGILLGEIKRALYGKSRALIKGYSYGLGGRDITKKDLIKFFQS